MVRDGRGNFIGVWDGERVQTCGRANYSVPGTDRSRVTVGDGMRVAFGFVLFGILAVVLYVLAAGVISGRSKADATAPTGGVRIDFPAEGR